MDVGRSGSLLREARQRAGLSQTELARRAGVTQSVVSAYESSARQPSLRMLDRLVAATGLELDVSVRSRRTASRRQRPLAARLHRRRQQVQRIAASHGLTNVRVFGSVARGEDTAESDIDLLVDVEPGVGLMGLARCQRELESLLAAPVDLVAAGDLKPGVAPSVLAEAMSL